MTEEEYAAEEEEEKNDTKTWQAFLEAEKKLSSMNSASNLFVDTCYENDKRKSRVSEAFFKFIEDLPADLRDHCMKCERKKASTSKKVSIQEDTIRETFVNNQESAPHSVNNDDLSLPPRDALKKLCMYTRVNAISHVKVMLHNRDLVIKMQKIIDTLDGDLKMAPLHHAVMHRNFEIMRKLVLDWNAGVNFRTEDGRSPLHLACNNNRGAFSLPIWQESRLGMLIGYYLLLRGSRGSEKEIYANNLKAVLSMNMPTDAEQNKSTLLSDENYLDRFFLVNFGDCTVEDLALSNRMWRNFFSRWQEHGTIHPITAFLLEHGAEWDSQDESNNLPIHHAVENNCWPQICELIHHAVANGKEEMINRKNKLDEMTPLHYAALNGLCDVILMLGPYCDTHKRDRKGRNALYCACKSAKLNAVKAVLYLAKLQARKKYPNQLKKSLEYYKELINEVDEENECYPILAAAQSNNPEIVKLLLEEGANLYEYDTETWHGMAHYAALSNGTKIMELLFNQENFDSAEFLGTDKETNTPIHMACIANSLECLKYMLNHLSRAEVLQDTNSSGMTPWMCAVEKNHVKLMEYLIDEHGEHINFKLVDFNMRSPLMIAVDAKATEMVNFLLKLDGQVSHYLNKRDANTNNPLLRAAECGYTSIVQSILDAGAKIAQRNDNHDTALHLAAENGRSSTVLCLLKHQDVNRTWVNMDGDTPLLKAARNGHWNVMNLILSEHEDLCEEENAYGMTALKCAANSGHEEVVNRLLKFTWHKDEDGEWQETHPTSLMLACRKGHVDVVANLLKNGANPAIRISTQYRDIPKDYNSLDIAIKFGKSSVVDVLLRCKEFDWKLMLQNVIVIRNQEDNTMSMTTPMRELIRRMPDQAMKVMDMCVDGNKMNASTEAFCVTYDFTLIDDTHAWCTQAHLDKLNYITDPEEFEPAEHGFFSTLFKRIDLLKILTNATTTRKKFRAKDSMRKHDIDDEYRHDDALREAKQELVFNPFYSTDEGQISRQALSYSESAQYIRFNHPLHLMTESSLSDKLLNHPLAKKLVSLKWLLYCGRTYILNLFFYLLFLIFTNYYVVSITATYKLTYDRTTLQAASFDQTCDSLAKSLPAGATSLNGNAIYPVKMIVIALTLLRVLMELYQLINRRLKYFLEPDNWLELAIFSLAFAFVYDGPACQKATQMRFDWQMQVGAALVFLAWMNLLLMMTKLPFVGVYIIMFNKVAWSFLKVCLLVLLFLVAYSFPLKSLLFNHLGFADIDGSLLKSGVMMMGEVDAGNIFNEAVAQGPNKKNVLFAKNLSYFFIIIFMINMNIILMNFLVGITADDIEGMRDNATCRRNLIWAQQALEYEAVFNPQQRRARDQSSAEWLPNSRPHTLGEYLDKYIVQKIFDQNVPDRAVLYNKRFKCGNEQMEDVMNKVEDLLDEMTDLNELVIKKTKPLLEKQLPFTRQLDRQKSRITLKK